MFDFNFGDISMNYSWLIDWAFKVLRIAVIVSGGWIVVHYIQKKIQHYLTSIYHDTLRVYILSKLFYYMGMFIIIIAVLYELNFNITALLGAAGVFGVAAGFAAQTSMANIISGLFLMLERPFQLGDTITVDNKTGSLKEINLFAITLQTPDNKSIRIPHEQLLKMPIINVGRFGKRRLDTMITLDYETNLDVLKKAVENVIKNNEYTLKDKEPFIRVEDFSNPVLTQSSDPCLYVRIGIWVDKNNYTQLYQTLLPQLKKEFEANNIRLV